MRGLKGKYVVIFFCIIILAAYQLLTSFNKLPYFFSAQDITVIILIIISIFLISILVLLARITDLLPRGKENLYVRMQTEDEINGVPELGPKGGKDYTTFFIALQRYLKGIDGINELMNKILVSAAKITRTERASILIYDKKKNNLCIYRTLGWKNSEINLASDIQIKPGEGIAGRVFLDEVPIIMNGASEKKENGTQHNYRSSSYVSFPIFSGETIIGVLNLTEKENGNYSNQEVNILKFITTEASIHLKNIPGNP
jgi:transcriptional regulator with GAF, ATPase, and Fis domain